MNESTDIDEGKIDLEASQAAPQSDGEEGEEPTPSSAPVPEGDEDDIQSNPDLPQPDGEGVDVQSPASAPILEGDKEDIQSNPDLPQPDEEGVDTQSAQSAPSLGGENDDLQADPTPPQPEGEKTGTGAETFIPKPDDGKVEVKSSRFRSIGKGDGGFRSEGNINMLMDLELSVAVELGRIQMYVKDILELGPGAVVELNKFSGEPVDIYVNEKIFAEGEVVVVEQNFGVRITAMVGPNEKLGNLK